jgi:hypothetical protein
MKSEDGRSGFVSPKGTFVFIDFALPVDEQYRYGRIPIEAGSAVIQRGKGVLMVLTR